MKDPSELDPQDLLYLVKKVQHILFPMGGLPKNDSLALSVKEDLDDLDAVILVMRDYGLDG